jgi:hypothetical protein
MPPPSEHKTVQARILAYAQAIGWTIVSREKFLQQAVAEISHAYSSSIPIQTGWRMSHSFAAFSGPTFLAQAARELAPAAAVRFNSTGARAP